MVILDPWNRPYIFDENYRWINSPKNAVDPDVKIDKLRYPDDLDYVGGWFIPKPGIGSGKRYRRIHGMFDIWSFGPNGKPDPGNNGEDDSEPKNDLVDETSELIDDVCSWH